MCLKALDRLVKPIDIEVLIGKTGEALPGGSRQFGSAVTKPDNPEIAYLAKVTAGATHELRNVLAIVKESARLVEEWARRADRGEALDAGKMRRATDRIETQVQRGAQLLSSLHQLAHSLGREQETIALHEHVTHFGILCQRLARRDDLVLRLATEEQGLSVQTDPVLLHVVLLAALECCQAQLPSSGTVTVATGQAGAMAWIEFSGQASQVDAQVRTEPAEDWYRLTALVDSLGVSLETTRPGRHFRLVLPIAGAA